MKRARQWLKDEGFSSVRDVSARDSCDFRATRNGEDWIVEVKGTTGGPGSILLTRNEVALHRAGHPRNALLLVHTISPNDKWTGVSGGELLAYSPWELDEAQLYPIAYEYRLSGPRG
jgi:hypothetical protein